MDDLAGELHQCPAKWADDPHTRANMRRAAHSMGLPEDQRLGPPPPGANVIELAKLALRFRRPISGALPTHGKTMAFLAQRILEDAGVRYWIGSAAGPETSITCVKCGATSHHPQDVENHFCGNCHVFHDDEARRALIQRIQK